MTLKKTSLLLCFVSLACIGLAQQTKDKTNKDKNLLMVVENGQTGYIDTLGKQVIPSSFAFGGQFNDGLACVAHPAEKNLRWTYINDKMDIVFKTMWDAAGDFSEGLARVMIKNKWGYIDKQGKTAIPPQFSLCYEFKNGYAQASDKDNKWGLINKKGEWVVQPQYYNITDYSEGMFGVCEKLGNKWKFITLEGKLAINDSFDLVRRFENGLAPVRINDMWGYIDKKGNMVVPAIYTGAREFSEGLACVQKDYNYWGYINTKGEVVIEFELGIDANFRYNYAWVEKNGNPVYINKQGKVTWQAR